MSISETFTDVTGVGDADVVSGNQLGVVEGDFTGQVWLEAITTMVGAEYVEVPNSRCNGSESRMFPVICPDPTVNYRWACSRVVGTARCYLGP